MLRKIIEINENKCNGCGACAATCHEGAIGMVDGKAVLLRDDYCDGLGDCLPTCPTGAITFTTREAAAYDEEAVKRSKQSIESKQAAGPVHTGCPGSRMMQFHREKDNQEVTSASAVDTVGVGTVASIPRPSQLCQWPVQIKLAPVKAPYFENAKLLIAADCTAYAYGSFHEDFIRGRVTLIGCPKLDAIDYSEKLTEIIRENNIHDVTIVRMEVPCCGGIEQACITALKNSGKFIPWQVVTISTDGKIL